MVKIRFGINTSFALRRWTQPKQWMELIHSKFELDVCELSLDLLDPMLREPTKTEYMQKMLELGDTYPIEIVSTRTGNNILTKDMLLNPNFGQRIDSIQWFERAIDIAAYTNSSYVGGYFGVLLIQDHVYPDLMEYLIQFLIDSMSYLASISYTAGLYGLNFEPFSLVPDEDENDKINYRILEKLKNSSKISIKLCPIVGKHNIETLIEHYPECIQMIQIQDFKDAKSVLSILKKGKYESKYSVNVILNAIPSFELSENEAISSIRHQVSKIKEILS